MGFGAKLAENSCPYFAARSLPIIISIFLPELGLGGQGITVM